MEGKRAKLTEESDHGDILRQSPAVESSSDVIRMFLPWHGISNHQL